MELTALVERAMRGDTAALGQALERCRPHALVVAQAILGDDQAAEDAVQDAFLVAACRVHEATNPAGFEIWLIEIVRRRSKHELGERRAHLTANLGDQRLEYDAEPALLNKMLASGILAMSGLRDDLRQILRMFYRDRLSVAQIGSVLNLSIGAVTERLYRARLLARHEFVDTPPRREFSRHFSALAAGPSRSVTTLTMALETHLSPIDRAGPTTYPFGSSGVGVYPYQPPNREGSAGWRLPLDSNCPTMIA